MARRASRRAVSLLAVAGAVLAAVLVALPGAQATETIRYAFPSGSYVIPMDGQQSDVLAAFGFAQSLVRAGVPVHRALSPPAVLLRLDPFAPAVPFDGGPIIVQGVYRAAFLDVASRFPSVTYFQITEFAVLDRVLPIKAPTDILVLKGGYNWGKTEVLLDQLGIPYDLRNTSDVEADPGLLFDYALVVVDCNGWHGADPGQAVVEAFQNFVTAGGHAMFTDIALKDMDRLFPGRLRLFLGFRGTFDAQVHTYGDAPSQYFGPTAIQVYTEIDSVVMGRPLASDVRVLLDLDDYPAGFLRTDYRVLAAYFPYGSGTVQGFAYHPFEQTGTSHTFSSILYGNVFVSAVPFLPPLPPPAPYALGLPTPPPAPPVPPPPPPPPSLPVVNMALAGYLAAGFAGVGITDVVRNRLALRAREKIAVRA